MGFTKETAAKAGKRSSRKGVPNKYSTTISTFCKYILVEENLEEFKENLRKLPPKEYVDVIIRLCQISSSKQGELIANDVLSQLLTDKNQ